ncbi:hypothetical protein AMAG_09406 [Allomyces macrogynus ATCC 38327]|uniref:Mitochondrial outer membrane protein porin n=1 Tax=Allomyces macrogynus (strain ATCC 38327) TaxID=578462 RepID=A0A0L0SPH4_ALLM3|nr:hypothetical protein AMAG_09406 [Allomyces macrogynus ATCC 38327]|eukprot:KNE64382.1 hypothetical protein AMAG_09406 [Allomyces macrogynus ATCC 38327]
MSIVFSDIGKAAADLLSKDFGNPGAIKAETKTTAANGVNFTVAANRDNKAGGVAAELKTKYADKSKGLTLTETWTTSNVLSGEIELADALTKGLKVTVLGALMPHANQKHAKIGAEFRQPGVATRAALDVFKGPIATADIAINQNGILAGLETAYDVSTGATTKYNLAVGMATSEYAVTAHVGNKLDTYAVAIYHKVAKHLETAARATWDRKAGAAVNMDVAAKYHLDGGAFAKVKFNNAGVLGLGYTQVLRPGVKVTVGGAFDTTRLSENVHKVGAAFVFEA